MILISLIFADHSAFFVSVGDMMKHSFDHIQVIFYLINVCNACLCSFCFVFRQLQMLMNHWHVFWKQPFQIKQTLYTAFKLK